MQNPLVALGLISAPVVACFGAVESARAGTECGMAAYYDQGSITANGESFDPSKLTVAHPSLPFDTWVTIVDQETGLSVEARINDRGPWDGARILDMTPATINAIDPEQTHDLRHVCIHW
ncbi:MAG: septal ring lytic transglycosylase RlpA family protein [Elainellaceae cyanobacterium]